MSANSAQVQDIFLAAADLLDPQSRSRFLDRACGNDADLRSRVEALLKAHGQPDSLLDVPVQPMIQAETRTADPTPGGAPESAVTHTHGPSIGRSHDDDLAVLTPSDRPGSLGRIGHYEVLEVLGRGGFGTVYRAFDDKLQRVVAVKVLAPQLATTSPARKRFLREAQSTAKIKHDHVVQIHETQEQPLPFLVMEYVPGETLQQRLDRAGPLDLSEILRVGRQVAEGLAAAHATGLVHRDVKPANVLIEDGPQHRVKLTDFGLARAADDASISQSGIVAGTPMYMAPEQAKGDSLDHRADLFSLGSVLYVMATGRPPFRASTTLAVLKRVIEDDPRPIREIIPEVPEWYGRIVGKLHAKDPADRFQTSHEVSEVLADCERQVATNGQLKDFSRIPGGGKPPKNRKVRRLVASLWGIAALFWAGILFAEPAWRYATNQAAIEVMPESGLTLFTVSRDGNVVTDGYDARTRPTITLPPGKYKLEPKFSPGWTVERWEITTRSTFASRTEWQGVLVPEFEVARGEKVTVRAVMRASQETTGAEGDSSGWLSLFNGRNLAGWKMAFGVPEGWKFEDGALVGSGRDNCLATRRQDYYDFHLRLEVNISAGGVGHVYSRGHIGLSDGVIESRIADTGTGGLTRISTKLDSPAKPVAVVPNEWFTLEIIAQGDRIETRVNGRLAAQAADAKRLGGPIGLQSGTPDTEIRFRKIEIKELPTFSPPMKDGFVSLFNGKDLTGWKIFPADRTSWTVKDGILTGSGKPSHLFTERGNFGNFHLRMETRIKRVAKGGAVGVFARVPVEDPGVILSPYGKKSLYRITVPKLYDEKAPPPEPAPPTYREEPTVVWGVDLKGDQTTIETFPADEWFTQEFILDGTHIAIQSESGVRSARSFIAAGAKALSGHLALQLFDDWSVVEFRKIEIKELPASPPAVPRTAAEVLPYLAGNWKVELRETHPKLVPSDASAVVDQSFDYVAGGRFLRSRGGQAVDLGAPHFLYSFDAEQGALRRWVAWSSGVATGSIVGAFNPESRTLLWMHRTATGQQSNAEVHFIDGNTQKVRLFRLDESGKLVRETHLVFTRIRGSVTIPDSPPDPKRPDETKVLDKLVGEWRTEMTATGAPKVQTRRVRAQSILGGRFVEVTETEEATNAGDYTLVWFDAEAKRYREWAFSSSGDVTELRGTWDEAAKSMTWQSQDGRLEGRWVFKGADLREYRHIVKDPEGKVLSEVNGVSRRVDSKRPLEPAPDLAVVQPLKDLVAAKERLRKNAKARFDATLASRMEVILAEVDLIEARVKLAEAESDRVAVVDGLKELVSYREEERGQVGERVKVGASAKSEMDAADARVAEAKARLAEAEKK